MNTIEIKQAIQSAHDHLMHTVLELTEDQCMQPPKDKWTGLQHIKHIALSINPVSKLLGDREKYFSRGFGVTDRGSLPYTEIEHTYISLLVPGLMAPQPFVPAALDYLEKESIREEFNLKVSDLIANIDLWTEEELDSCLIPHPLLGQLTLREMLYFSIYHAGHHKRNIDRTLIS